MKTLAHATDKAEILARIALLTPQSPRRWGRMNVHQMVCHLNDAFKCAWGERQTPLVGTIFHRVVVKWIALQVPLRWPKGIVTRPEFDQEQAGTPPVEFVRDVAELVFLIEKMTASPRSFEWGEHPIFGRMSEAEWLRWGYLHADHHLRQFSR
ncbi:MAG: DUF1569 domain-containing protein [Blastocatellia bacterium]|nr:DUF1569 domain-containing protein [Blastocatellia bacterium]